MARRLTEGELSIVACPDCQLPAEILERFSLNSTDGIVGHVALACVGGHYFRMSAAGLLPETRPAEVPQAASGLAPSGLAVSCMPGRLGTVGDPAAVSTAAADGLAAAASVGSAAAMSSQPPGTAR